MSAKKTPPKDKARVAEGEAADVGNTPPTDDGTIATGKQHRAAPQAGQVADDAAAEAETGDDLMTRLEEAEARADEYLDSLQRERATFQNYKRRIERERTEQVQAITGSLLLKLLPTLDDFYRALDAVPEAERDQWFEGVVLILRKLERFLSDEGVTEIDAVGQPFDPTYHEAVGIDTDSDAASGTVTQVLQRGYMIGDRVLRPALVRVAE